MFENFLNFIVKASSLQPDYHPEHCIQAVQSSAFCRVCRDACPHEAITIRRQVAIDDIDCTGCGLCVQACPSQALEPKLSYQSGAPIKCSQVKGGAQTVQCLARLSPSDLLRLAGKKEKVTLVRAECKACHIGSEAVPEVMAAAQEEAQAIAELRDRKLTFETLIADSYDATDNPDPISRRELLRGGWRGLQRSAADALAPFDPGDDDDAGLPNEMQRQFNMMKAAKPTEDEFVPWTLPRVAEGCIMCPVCTNACPTNVFSRAYPEPDVGILKLDPERCNGCEACVRVCPVEVISLERPVTWGEIAEGEQEVYRKDDRDQGAQTVAR